MKTETTTTSKLMDTYDIDEINLRTSPDTDTLAKILAECDPDVREDDIRPAKLELVGSFAAMDELYERIKDGHVVDLDDMKPINVGVDGRKVTLTWPDGTKESAKCSPDDAFDLVTGIAQCIAKKTIGRKTWRNLCTEVRKAYDHREDDSASDTVKIKVEED